MCEDAWQEPHACLTYFKYGKDVGLYTWSDCFVIYVSLVITMSHLDSVMMYNAVTLILSIGVVDKNDSIWCQGRLKIMDVRSGIKNITAQIF